MASDEVVGDNAPIEFTYQGRRFRIHSVLARWRTAGEWWNRLGPTSHTHSPEDHSREDRTAEGQDGEAQEWQPDDQTRSLWKVEAAPLGALRTFELERDEATGQWRVRDL